MFHVLLGIFVASGFAGLIYESVWAQYLKLFLGHAAYAQTVVLCIFMGGLALGAWLAARHTRRIKQPLLAYAVIEAGIGLLGLVFHGVFTRGMDFHYHYLLPLSTDPLAVTTLKGLLALLLIGPQTVLLGATFPLMTAGVLRALPHASGKKIALLYFSNSIGAAAGVLASVFIFIPWSGLPGTMLSAGLINMAVALCVWLVVRRGDVPDGSPYWPASDERASAGEAGSARGASSRVLLLVAAFTGMASFIYEVVWIRMLSLVLGSSTHSFELMLSAFITGLALGSLAIRRRVDRLANPARTLGYIQIIMGLFALGSLWVYSQSFHWMSGMLNAIARTEQGYNVFLFGSHAVCFAIMLPATFMAGMTLPLITHGLLRQGYGERALGNVYAVNTLGSIAGVVIALHLLIPLTGLKSALIIGGGIDILIGIALLSLTAAGQARLRTAVPVVASVAGMLAAALGVTLDPYRLNSGVYRYQRSALAPDTRFLYTADGKTATIALYQRPNGSRVLATNGKPDASLMPLSEPASRDEITQILAGYIGLAFHPDARTAANIGMGSGMTTHSLLHSRRLQAVDTIEIEQKMVEATQLLRDRVGGVFTDSRSRIIIDDAKSFFAAQRARYDIIVAEPSNPWVSGVASLFTGEFYRRMLDHLTDDGVFVQWVQIYEIDHESVASIMLALGRAFPNYTMYTSNDLDLLIVAWKRPDAREPDAKVLEWPELRAQWERISIRSLADLEARRVGSRAVLEPLFRSYPVPENSDYFPYLEHRAPRARFRDLNASGYKLLGSAGLPMIEMMERRPFPYRETRLSDDASLERSVAMRDAFAAHRYLMGDKMPPGLKPVTRGHLATLAHYCSGGLLFRESDAIVALVAISNAMMPFLPQQEVRQSLGKLLQDKCLSGFGETGRLMVEMIERTIERDGAGMRRLGDRLLEQLPQDADRQVLNFAVDSAMVGAIASGDPAHARSIWQRHGKRVQTGAGIPIENRLLMSTAEVRTQRR